MHSGYFDRPSLAFGFQTFLQYFRPLTDNDHRGWRAYRISDRQGLESKQSISWLAFTGPGGGDFNKAPKRCELPAHREPRDADSNVGCAVGQIDGAGSRIMAIFTDEHRLDANGPVTAFRNVSRLQSFYTMQGKTLKSENFLSSLSS